MTSKLLLTSGAAPSAPASGKIAVYGNASNILAFIGSDGVAKSVFGGASVNSNPADPSGTTDTTGKMMGLAVAFTPATTGIVQLNCAGLITNSTATAGDGCMVQMTYGTGSAPANAAALTGTAVGNIAKMLLERSTASDPYPFSCIAIVSGLMIGTAYWLDLRAAAITGGTATPKGLAFTVWER